MSFHCPPEAPKMCKLWLIAMKRHSHSTLGQLASPRSLSEMSSQEKSLVGTGGKHTRLHRPFTTQRPGHSHLKGCDIIRHQWPFRAFLVVAFAGASAHRRVPERLDVNRKRSARMLANRCNSSDLHHTLIFMLPSTSLQGIPTAVHAGARPR